MTGEGEGETRRRKVMRIKTQKRGECNKVTLRRGETTESEMIKTETGGGGGGND